MHHGGCRSHSEHLVAVAKKNYRVRIKAAERVGKSVEASGHCLCPRVFRRSFDMHVHPFVDTESGRGDFVDGHAELGQEVHVGGDDRELDVVVGLECACKGHEKSPVGTGCGDDAHFLYFFVLCCFRHHSGILVCQAKLSNLTHFLSLFYIKNAPVTVCRK